MRNIFIALLLSGMLFSCNQKELKTLREEVQVMKMEAQEKDASIASFMESFNEIEKNLAEIRERELNIALKNKETRENPNIQAQIKEDIKVINTLIEENKKTIEDLNQQLKTSKGRNVELNRMLTRIKDQLNEQILQKDQEIAQLKENLNEMNNTVASLSHNLDTLKSAHDELTRLNEENVGIIEERTNLMNTAYVAMGTARELKKENIVVKEGGFLGIGKTERLNGAADESAFTKIDIRETKIIPIEARKIELVTSHPADSYKINGSDMVESIEITQPEKFWNHSKYLVVRVN